MLNLIIRNVFIKIIYTTHVFIIICNNSFQKIKFKFGFIKKNYGYKVGEITDLYLQNAL